MITVPDWSQANCLGEDPHLFDLDMHHHHALQRSDCLLCADAADLCQFCPIAEGCLKYGKSLRTSGLIWGGHILDKGRPRRLR